MRILALESSCDEFAGAVVEDGRRVLSSVVASQVDLHGRYGGVVPELAGREHLRSLVPVLQATLEQAGQRWEGSVLVTLGETRNWPVTSLAEVTAASLAPLRAMDPAIDILLLGCGPSMAYLDPALRQAIKDLGLALEAMDSGAACRTFNLLMGEERRVAAALIAVPD